MNDKAVAGVIHQPFYSEEENPINYDTRTIWGIVGVGTGDFKHVQPPKDRRILVTTKSHHSSRVELALNSIKADEVIRVGGTGCKVKYLNSFMYQFVRGIIYFYLLMIMSPQFEIQYIRIINVRDG